MTGGSGAALRPALLIAPLAALAVLAAGARAQEPKELFLDAVDVNVVDVEVVVTDAEGEPVTGLTAADFEVYEDGERVEINNFYAVHRRTSAPSETGAGEAAKTPPLSRVDATASLDIEVGAQGG